MNDPLQDLPWPAWVTALGLALVGLLRVGADVVTHVRALVRPPVKSEREILSQDQQALVDRLEARLDKVEEKLDQCETREAARVIRDVQIVTAVNELLTTAKLQGVELAMNLGSIAPIPPLAPQPTEVKP